MSNTPAARPSSTLAASLFDKSGRVQQRIARAWARASVWCSGSRVQITGLEHLPSGPAVYAANHTSYMDTPAVFSSLPFQFRILAKKELWSIPFIDWYLSRSGQIPIDTANPRASLSSLGNGVKALREQGWPESILNAILAHADYSGVPRDSHLERALFACDELAGFLTACALVKPSRSIAEVEVAGIKKKMKDKAFARAVKREDITTGAELLNLPLEDHLANCLAAMQSHATELGLAPVLSS